MAISTNTYLRSLADGFEGGVPIVPGQVIYQGDLVVWDQTLAAGNGSMRSVAAQADLTKFLGIAGQQSPMAAGLGNMPYLQCIRTGIVRLHSNPGETYTMYQALYWLETADAQTITNNTNAGARTHIIGYAIIPPQSVMGGLTSFAGGAGIDLEVALSPNFPVVDFC